MPASPQTTDMTAPEQVDVIVVGAGIAGIGSAYHLATAAPDKRFMVVEEQASFGGTWLTHRYPGVRSDSDLHTFGYAFKPWRGPPIATADEILAYMGEVIEENGLDRYIRYRTRVAAASWSSDTARWTLELHDLASGETRTVTARFLWMCQGYYRHGQGYTPDWPDMAAFKGTIVHPQHWPADLDLDGKRVVVIGSGATAATPIARSRSARSGPQCRPATSPMTCPPLATAPVAPTGESSMIAQSAMATPSRSAAYRYRSGAGLPRATCSRPL